MGVRIPNVGVDRMQDFHLDASALQEQLQGARQLAATDLADGLLDRAQRGDSLSPADIAVLWFASRVDTETLYEVACSVAAGRHDRLETFSPLYMTNTCDAECRMCGMRRDNDALRRETADITGVIDQLRVLQRRGMH